MRFPGIIPAVTTPFDTGGRVDLDALARNLEVLLDAGVHGLVATGTMGEATMVQSASAMIPTSASRITIWTRLVERSKPITTSTVPSRAGRKTPTASTTKCFMKLPEPREPRVPGSILAVKRSPNAVAMR